MKYIKIYENMGDRLSNSVVKDCYIKRFEELNEFREIFKKEKFIGESKEYSLKNFTKVLINLYGKDGKLEINDIIKGEREIFVHFLDFNGICYKEVYRDIYNRYGCYASWFLEAVYYYLIDKYKINDFIGENKVEEMSEEEKSEALIPLAKILVNVYGKNGKLEINDTVYYHEFSRFIYYITPTGLYRETENNNPSIQKFIRYEHLTMWFKAIVYDYLIDKYGEHDFDKIIKFIGEGIIYEKKNYNISFELIKTLDYNTLSEYYYDNYHEAPDFEYLIDYFYELWEYVDDKKFIQHWISIEAPRLASDGWNVDIEDKFFDIDQMLIDYIKKETGSDDGLYDLELEELKTKVTSMLKRNDFCKQLLEIKYGESSAEDMYEDYYGTTNRDIFMDDDFDICEYLNVEQMSNDYIENRDVSWSDIIEELSSNLDYEPTLQKMIWNNDETTCVSLVEEVELSRELGILPDFQRSYLTAKTEELVCPGYTTDIDNLLWFLMKKYFFEKNIPIDKEVADEFGFLHFIEGHSHGFIV